MRSIIVLLALIGASTSAYADDDPDTEVAKRHFKAGLKAYEAFDYKTACAEFEAARKIFPKPAFDFNIGRCYDRQEMYDQAVEAYMRFTNAVPKTDKDVVEALKRIEILRGRLSPKPVVQAAVPVPAIKVPETNVPIVPTPLPSPVPSPPKKQKVLLGTSLALAGVAVVGLAAGLGTWLSIDGKIARLNETCAYPCEAEKPGIRGLENVSYSLFAVGTAAAVASIATGLVYRFTGSEAKVAIVPVIHPHTAGLAVGGTL